MKSLPQISEAEFEVMKVVWQNAPISTNEVTDRLVNKTSWSPKTIQTMLKRLVSKGALTYEKRSRVFVYTPLVEENEYLEHQSISFLNRYYNGNLASMVNSYIDNKSLSQGEIRQLRMLLAKAENKE